MDLYRRPLHRPSKRKLVEKEYKIGVRRGFWKKAFPKWSTFKESRCLESIKGKENKKQGEPDRVLEILEITEIL